MHNIDNLLDIMLQAGLLVICFVLASIDLDQWIKVVAFFGSALVAFRGAILAIRETNRTINAGIKWLRHRKEMKQRRRKERERDAKN